MLNQSKIRSLYSTPFVPLQTKYLGAPSIRLFSLQLPQRRQSLWSWKQKRTHMWNHQPQKSDNISPWSVWTLPSTSQSNRWHGGHANVRRPSSGNFLNFWKHLVGWWNIQVISSVKNTRWYTQFLPPHLYITKEKSKNKRKWKFPVEKLTSNMEYNDLADFWKAPLNSLSKSLRYKEKSGSYFHLMQTFKEEGTVTGLKTRNEMFKYFEKEQQTFSRLLKSWTNSFWKISPSFRQRINFIEKEDLEE